MAQTPCTSDNCSLQLQNKQDKIEKLEIELDAVSKALGAVIKANFGLSDEVIRLGGQSIAKACLEDYATIHRNDTGAKRQRRDSAASSSCPPDPESSEQSRVSLVIPMPQGYNWKRLNAEVKEDVADHSQETLDKIAQDADDRLKKAKLVLKQPSEQAQIDEERKAERKAEKNRKAQAAYRAREKKKLEKLKEYETGERAEIAANPAPYFTQEALDQLCNIWVHPGGAFIDERLTPLLSCSHEIQLACYTHLNKPEMLELAAQEKITARVSQCLNYKARTLGTSKPKSWGRDGAPLGAWACADCQYERVLCFQVRPEVDSEKRWVLMPLGPHKREGEEGHMVNYITRAKR